MANIEELLRKQAKRVEKIKQQAPAANPRVFLERRGATRPWQENLEKYQVKEGDKPSPQADAGEANQAGTCGLKGEQKASSSSSETLNKSEQKASIIARQPGGKSEQKASDGEVLRTIKGEQKASKKRAFAADDKSENKASKKRADKEYVVKRADDIRRAKSEQRATDSAHVTDSEVSRARALVGEGDTDLQRGHSVQHHESSPAAWETKGEQKASRGETGRLATGGQNEIDGTSGEHTLLDQEAGKGFASPMLPEDDCSDVFSDSWPPISSSEHGNSLSPKGQQKASRKAAKSEHRDDSGITSGRSADAGSGPLASSSVPYSALNPGGEQKESKREAKGEQKASIFRASVSPSKGEQKESKKEAEEEQAPSHVDKANEVEPATAVPDTRQELVGSELAANFAELSAGESQTEERSRPKEADGFDASLSRLVQSSEASANRLRDSREQNELASSRTGDRIDPRRKRSVSADAKTVAASSPTAPAALAQYGPNAPVESQEGEISAAQNTQDAHRPPTSLLQQQPYDIDRCLEAPLQIIPGQASADSKHSLVYNEIRTEAKSEQKASRTEAKGEQKAAVKEANQEQKASERQANCEQNGSRTEAKHEQNASLNGSKTGAKGEQFEALLTLHLLSGIQRAVVCHLADLCKISRSTSTPPVNPEMMSGTLKTTGATVKNAIYRLLDKGYLSIVQAKRGRGGWTSFTMPQPIYRQALEANAVHLSDMPDLKKEAEREAKKEASPPSSSSRLLRFTSTTTEQPSSGDRNLATFFAEALAHCDFHLLGANDAMQIWRTGKYEQPHHVVESIEHMAYYLDSGMAQQVGKPKNFVMSTLLKGYFGRPAGFKSQEEKAEEAAAAAAEERAASLRALRLRRVEAEFECWREELATEERESILREQFGDGGQFGAPPTVVLGFLRREYGRRFNVPEMAEGSLG